ncbi:hypothetical protein KCP70_02520 [Salmonella enterica subsp. enterica]|nr:hypothetical protein KCP70_02520 [Salmonella enterica subsp. enterica]
MLDKPGFGVELSRALSRSSHAHSHYARALPLCGNAPSSVEDVAMSITFT